LNNQKLSHYYLMQTTSKNVIYITALLKSCDNVAFHRTVEGTSNVIEYFVAPERQNAFEDLLEWLTQCKLEFTIEKKINRFTHS